METAENTRRGRILIGTLQMIAGAVMLSFSAVFVKWAHVGPTMAGFYRMFFGGLILLGAILVKKERLFHGSHHLKTVFICGLLFALDITLWHRSIHFIGPGLSTLMANFQVFFLALFGMIILKEKSNWKFFVSIPAAILGLYLIVAPNWNALGGEYRAGVVLALLTAISYATYILVLRNFQSKFTVSALPTIGLVSLITALVLALEALLINESFVIPDAQSWGLDVAMPVTFIGMIIPFVKTLPMVVCVLTAGAASLLTLAMPYKLGIVVSAFAGIAAGLMAQRIMNEKKGALQR